MEIQIIFPSQAEDALDLMLVEITKAISEVNDDAVAHGFLGGEYGYGAEWDNSVFTMRPYYWGDCDCGVDEDAPHLKTCALELPNFLHKPSGFEVRWYKWIGRGMEYENAPKDLTAMFNECIQSVKGANHG